MEKKNVLSVKNLNKIYSKKSKSIHAINNLNLDVQEGEIFGLLGPNGAGKSTFINILAGTVIKTSGDVNVWGFNLDKNPRQVRASVGIVPQEVVLDPFFSPKKLLELQAGLYGVKKKDRITDAILKLVSLEKQAHSYARSLSGGMKRRLLIAKALVHQPPIIFLDEPTAGVDVELRKDMWKIVRQLQNKGVTIILTTHYIEEAEEIAERVGVINNGELLVVEKKELLMENFGKKQLIIELREAAKEIPHTLHKHNVELTDDGLNISYTYDTTNEGSNIQAVLKEVSDSELLLKDIKINQSSLEDIFVDLVKLK